MGHVIRLTSESREAQSRWHWMKLTSCHTLHFCGCVKTCGGAYKVHIQLHIDIHTQDTQAHVLYVHSGTHDYRHTHSLSQSPSLPILPCVSSFALSCFLCEEGPNFSLISFIKRCGEERRKRRRGEGEKGEKRGWGVRLVSDE